MANSNNSIFGNMQFGPINDNRIGFSHLGLAIKNNEGKMVSYDKNKGDIIDVDLIDFSVPNGIFGIPVAISQITTGDIVLRGDKPMIVTGKNSNKVEVVDVAAGEVKTVLPTKSMFGFDFITKVVSIMDSCGNSASEDNPFGNMLPLMMLSGNEGNMSNMLLPMMLMQKDGDESIFGKIDMSNPLMLMAMMGGSEGTNFFTMMLMTQLLSPSETPSPAQ